ncbi:polysaccharide biosynthesis protein [Tamilnaduibacter salinus]|uniref:Capsule biosynthesis protein CapD n=1 Tax=Tamilnaduibacter salinus TaxID=1484056 RepID=A0A2A2I128_9GAMM|nr:polysaccharide biosynthesis protein [Tamilnaduibacter salinus]PAV24996.1 capsule biosynthesis protein CapD [Tamilnaduibacter salinus]PVY70829.1 polysaccharide biosynthesis protein [Tamilnaduibacter salinus]
MGFFEGKRVLVTGACGTVGSEFIQQLLTNEEYQPAEVIGIDNQETALFFEDQRYLDDNRAYFFIADVRDKDELVRRMKGVDVVFHTAALKHVILCERSPDQAVHSNVLGVQNVISAAIETDVDRVIFTSSDKAVNPTNVMGTSKLMGERLITAANSNKRSGKGPVFASTRFGNVLGSSGSVIPIFHKQIAKGGPVTLTDPEMTRFIMSIEESVRLVIDSAIQAKGGEVFITKMPVIRISDLAQSMIDRLAPVYGFRPEDIRVDVIGSKPGEKLYEELMSDEETRRAIELEDYFSVVPAFRGIYQDIDYNYDGVVSQDVDNAYVSASEPALSQSEIAALLQDKGLLSEPSETTDQRYWPGDKEQSRSDS